MKNAVLLTLALLGMASFADPALQGVWTIDARVCSSGPEANDRFQIGRDSMTLTIQGDDAQLVTVIEGQSYTKNFSVLAELYDYTVSQGQLRIITSGFGPGGSCKPGETLYSFFNKKA